MNLQAEQATTGGQGSLGEDHVGDGERERESEWERGIRGAQATRRPQNKTCPKHETNMKNRCSETVW